MMVFLLWISCLFVLSRHIWAQYMYILTLMRSLNIITYQYRSAGFYFILWFRWPGSRLLVISIFFDMCATFVWRMISTYAYSLLCPRLPYFIPAFGNHTIMPCNGITRQRFHDMSSNIYVNFFQSAISYQLRVRPVMLRCRGERK